MDSLLNFVANNKLGKILLLGDFNARTRNCNHDTNQDELGINFDALARSSPTEALRTSKDKTLNKRGKIFLDFIASTNLMILNGSIAGDILGEFTSVNYHGSSVVDYACSSNDLLKHVMSFKVGNLNMFSDHKPCYTTIATKCNLLLGDDLLDSLEDSPSRFKLDSSNPLIGKAFLESQEDHETKEKLVELTSYSCNNENDVNNLNHELIQIYHGLANKITPPKVQTQRIARKVSKLKTKRRMKPKLPWFDPECINSKRELNRLAFKYGKNPLDSEVRDLYYLKRKNYKKLVKSKKRDFISKLSQDIENGNNIDWTRFKKLKSLGTKNTSLDVFDLLNFCNFFKSLYTKKELKYPDNTHDGSSALNDSGTFEDEVKEILDKEITRDELDDAIKKTKSGKAV